MPICHSICSVRKSLRMATAEYQRDWRAKNPDKVREYETRRKPESVVQRREKARLRSARNYEMDSTKYAKWANHIKRKFGITPEFYYEILHSQDNRCAICKTAEPGGRGRFHVDHCHVTGKIRGLLCFRCNTGITSFEKSGTLEAAVDYLKKEIS